MRAALAKSLEAQRSKTRELRLILSNFEQDGWIPSRAPSWLGWRRLPTVAVGCTIESSQEANGIPGLYTKLPRGGNCDVFCKSSEL
jgi:hypothetical protein